MKVKKKLEVPRVLSQRVTRPVTRDEKFVEYRVTYTAEQVRDMLQADACLRILSQTGVRVPADAEVKFDVDVDWGSEEVEGFFVKATVPEESDDVSGE